MKISAGPFSHQTEMSNEFFYLQATCKSDLRTLLRILPRIHSLTTTLCSELQEISLDKN